MGGGGGLFQLVRIFFFTFFACVDNFFKYNTLHEFFLFQLIIFHIEKSLDEFFLFQLIIFHIEKSLDEFFFQTFLVH